MLVALDHGLRRQGAGRGSAGGVAPVRTRVKAELSSGFTDRYRCSVRSRVKVWRCVHRECRECWEYWRCCGRGRGGGAGKVGGGIYAPRTSFAGGGDS